MGTISGEELMSIVAEYDALGEHRTGDRAERPTAEWLADRIRQLGGHAELHPYGFERFAAAWEARIDGTTVESLPLWYSGEFDLRAVRAPIVPASPCSAAGEHQRFEDEERLLASAIEEQHRALAVATTHPDGELVALNRVRESATPLPVVCVRGDTIEAGADQPTAEIDLRTSIRSGVGWNVVGRFDATPNDPCRRSRRHAPLLIATPSSGWFHCAGERGTGIAAALAVAQAVVEANDGAQPVVLLATSGHEIGHLGALASAPLVPDELAGIVHVGASVAARADAQSEQLTRHLIARTNATGHACEAVRQAMAGLGIRVDVPSDPRVPGSWVGESRRWATRGEPLLSLAGWFPEFHTPADRADATTPTLLASVAAGLVAATMALLS